MTISKLISVIIPAKKEAGTIIECVSRVLQVCPEAEVWVIDSGLQLGRRCCTVMGATARATARKSVPIPIAVALILWVRFLN